MVANTGDSEGREVHRAPQSQTPVLSTFRVHLSYWPPSESPGSLSIQPIILDALAYERLPGAMGNGDKSLSWRYLLFFFFPLCESPFGGPCLPQLMDQEIIIKEPPHASSGLWPPRPHPPHSLGDPLRLQQVSEALAKTRRASSLRTLWQSPSLLSQDKGSIRGPGGVGMTSRGCRQWVAPKGFLPPPFCALLSCGLIVLSKALLRAKAPWRR